METIREKRETLEAVMLAPFGVRASASRGRAAAEAPCAVRTCFQRDVDRITHSKAFRRLKHKTQVFLHPEGDHYRTRLTHTLEVARIARTIARGLGLNEDLTEAIALGHDLGHTPFGHAGERALDEIYPGGFRHYEQSLRVADFLEKGGRGLNLCYETRMGILHHTHGSEDDTLEARVVRLSDRVAYINHDTDDAIRAGILTEAALPAQVKTVLGESHSARINAIVQDIILESGDGRDIRMSEAVGGAVALFHGFMHESVYRNPVAKGEERKVKGILEGLYTYYIKHPDALPDDYKALSEQSAPERVVCDYVSGMTDQYAVHQYNALFIPVSWQVR